MKNPRPLLHVILALSLLIPASSYAIDPWLDWKTIESSHFRLHYHEGGKELAVKAINIAERAHKKLSAKYSWRPAGKTELVISDEMDFANGYATPIPFNESVFFATPPDNGTYDFDDWLEWLITHEYTHIIHLDKVGGFPRVLRSIFGRLTWFFPNAFQPTWLVEGLATYEETDVERGYGRGQSSLFAMMMRAEIENGLKPVNNANITYRKWPLGTLHYLYGVYFYQFLEHQYGQEAATRYVAAYSGNIVPFRINSTHRKVFGKKLKPLWSDFNSYLQKRFLAEIETVRKQGVVEGTRLTDDGFFINSLRVLQGGEIYYIQDTGVKHPAIMQISAGGKPKRYTNVHASARMDVQNNAGFIIAQPEVCRNEFIYYDLYRIKPGKHYKKRLTKCGRYPFATWSPSGDRIAAVHTGRGQSAVHILDLQGKIIDVLWQGSNDEIVTNIDWSPDGEKLLASVWRAGHWNIETLDISSAQWTALTTTGSIDSRPQYSADGQSVLYNSDASGIFNIKRLHLATGNTETVTNVVMGAFEPAQLNERSPLYYVGYGANGYDLYRLDRPDTQTPPQLNPQIANSGSVAGRQTETYVEQENFAAKNYSPWQSLKPRWWFPYFGSSEEGLAVGAMTGGSDALRAHYYEAALTYETYSSNLSGYLYYNFHNRMGLLLGRDLEVDLLNDGVDGDDDDEEILRVRANDFAQLTLLQPLYRVERSWQFMLNATIDEETDIETAPGIERIEDTRDNLAGIGIRFDSTNSYIQSISVSDGRNVRLVAESYDVFDSLRTGKVYTLDWREYFRLGGEHVLAFRYVRGHGTDDPKPFELGGENNVYVSSLSNQAQTDLRVFAVRDYNLRGYPENLPELEGRRMELGSLEYRFPLGRPEFSYMAPPIGLSQWSGNVFVDSGRTWNLDDDPEKYYTGAGIEIDLEIVLFYGAPVKTRLGYAHGFDEGGEDRVYLSIGAAF
jgi:hypothetical protein